MANKTASKWVDGDSSRKMTNKYNDVVDIVNETSKNTGEINEKTQKELDKINKELNKKIESVSKDDIGLGNVDNTSDMNKPVSVAQSKAIDRATEEQIESQPADMLIDDPTFTSKINTMTVQDQTLVFILNSSETTVEVTGSSLQLQLNNKEV